MTAVIPGAWPPWQATATSFRQGYDRYTARAGALAETMRRGWDVSFNPVAIAASGTLRIVPIALPLGARVSNIATVFATAAVGPSHWWFALADQNRLTLAVTADQLTAAIGANQESILPLTSPFTTTYEGLYYIGLSVSVATTLPGYYGTGTAQATIEGLAPNLGGHGDTIIVPPAGRARASRALRPNLAAGGISNVAGNVYAYVS